MPLTGLPQIVTAAPPRCARHDINDRTSGDLPHSDSATVRAVITQQPSADEITPVTIDLTSRLT